MITNYNRKSTVTNLKIILNYGEKISRDSEKPLATGSAKKISLKYAFYNYYWLFIVASINNYFYCVKTCLDHGVGKSLDIIVTWNHHYGDKASCNIYRITIRKLWIFTRNVYEIVGLIGSAVMLGGVVFIKPIVLSLKTAEKEQRELVEKLQDAFSKIKTLSGFLPICASCKKIRDDKGYWNQIETYISDHSEAEFTHGICPDCTRKLYPEFFNDKH